MKAVAISVGDKASAGVDVGGRCGCVRPLMTVWLASEREIGTIELIAMNGGSRSACGI